MHKIMTIISTIYCVVILYGKVRSEPDLNPNPVNPNPINPNPTNPVNPNPINPGDRCACKYEDWEQCRRFVWKKKWEDCKHLIPKFEEDNDGSN